MYTIYYVRKAVCGCMWQASTKIADHLHSRRSTGSLSRVNHLKPEKNEKILASSRNRLLENSLFFRLFWSNSTNCDPWNIRKNHRIYSMWRDRIGLNCSSAASGASFVDTKKGMDRVEISLLVWLLWKTQKFPYSWGAPFRASKIFLINNKFIWLPRNIESSDCIKSHDIVPGGRGQLVAFISCLVKVVQIVVFGQAHQ